MEEQTKRLKLSGGYNIRGALGMKDQSVSIELLTSYRRTHCPPSYVGGQDPRQQH